MRAAWSRLNAMKVVLRCVNSLSKPARLPSSWPADNGAYLRYLSKDHQRDNVECHGSQNAYSYFAYHHDEYYYNEGRGAGEKYHHRVDSIGAEKYRYSTPGSRLSYYGHSVRVHKNDESSYEVAGPRIANTAHLTKHSMIEVTPHSTTNYQGLAMEEEEESVRQREEVANLNRQLNQVQEFKNKNKNTTFWVVAFVVAVSLINIAYSTGLISRSLHGAIGSIEINKGTNVARKGQNKVKGPKQSLPLPDFVQLMDDPYVIRLPKVNKETTVVSAIRVPSEDMIVFIVVDKPEDILSNELPGGMQCAFGSGDEKSKMPLFVYATHLRYYRSASVWACRDPGGLSKHTQVAIVPPGDDISVEVLSGHGVFNIVEPAKYDEDTTQTLVSCGKTIFNLDNRTVADLQTYYHHYQSIGVRHFVFYAHQSNVEVARIFQTIQNLSPSEGSTVTLYLLPTSYDDVQGFETKKSHPKTPQYFTTTDCNWKSRGADWVLMQFDNDEILVGTKDLRLYLNSIDTNVKAIHVPHYLPKEDYLPLDGSTFHVASIKDNDWGKTLYRPQFVNISWVHAPTNPELEFSPPGNLQLIHFRREKQSRLDYLHKNNATWKEFKYSTTRSDREPIRQDRDSRDDHSISGLM